MFIFANMKQGDKVQIVNYGGMGFDKQGYKDLYPELIGRIAVIKRVEYKDGKPFYILNGIPYKAGPYFADQLEEVF